jgi:thiol-disulfide isomerase/thioredoxin
MRKVDQSATSSTFDTPVATEPVEQEKLATTETSVAQVVTQTIQKVIPKPKVTPPKAIARYTEFVNPSGFINTEPFSMADYIGKKIILVEFITYSCINCQRTFPFMKQWHETYAKDGLLVVGIHTPEFAYERDRDNVIAAMKKESITFPIVQDNEYETWNAYSNRFWPHRYIIDYDGNVVFDHIGEGAYAETEAVIKQLLETKPNES